MKKSLVYFVLLCALTFPLSLFAASGACSGHGGVSCAAGPDRDGSVICEDGWRNSSVQYSTMVKCGSATAQSNVALPTILPAPAPVEVKKSEKKIVQPAAKPIPVPIQKAEVKSEPKKISTTTPVSAPAPSVEKNISGEKSAESKIITVPKKGFWARLWGR